MRLQSAELELEVYLEIWSEENPNLKISIKSQM